MANGSRSTGNANSPTNRSPSAVDNLTQDLMGRGRISLADTREPAGRLIGAPPKTLDTPLLD